MILLYSIIFCFLHIIVNQIVSGSKKKLILIIFFNIFVISFFFKIFFLDLLIYYLCLQYLFLNVYTIKYSSIRYLILDKIIKKERIPSEEWLYENRLSRLKNNRNKKIIMQKKIFYFLQLIIRFFNFIFK
jgi:hypothetical protein